MSVTKEVKQKVKELLDGNLTIGVINVPLFDGKEEGNATTYVLMGISGLNTENDTFDLLVQDMNLDFDVVAVRESTVKSEILEDIGQQIKDAINPTKNTIGFSLDAPMHLVSCELAAETEMTSGLAPSNKMIFSKRITFRTTVTQ